MNDEETWPEEHPTSTGSPVTTNVEFSPALLLASTHRNVLPAERPALEDPGATP